MNKARGSGTALITSYIRGYHVLHDEPRIFDDVIGYRLLTEEARKALERHLIMTSSQMSSGAVQALDDESALRMGVSIMAGSILARARYVEDRLDQVVKNHGVRQYVILGAGLDTFAFRRLDLADRLQVFEIDRPNTQNGKRSALKQACLKEPDNLHFVPIDFTLESLSSALERSDYDPLLPSFFCWAGVTHYLPLEAVYATLTDIVNMSVSSSEVVFDYWDKDAFDPDKSSSRIKSLIENSRSIEEPIITGFDPDQLSQDLTPLGLRLVENLGPGEIRDRCRLEDIGYTTSRHVHFACAEVK